MANDEVLGPRKTMFVLVIVVGCFAVLWPRLLSPLILGHTADQLKPNKFDREAGCCEVIFETDVAVLELVNEVCSTVHGDGKLSLHSAAECRKAVNETCGLDIAAFVKRNENVGKTTKLLVESLKNSNSSCLRSFGVPVYSVGSHFAVNSWKPQDTLKQERPSIRMGPHPALRERGRAIPPGPPPPSRPVALPPHVRVRSPLSVYYELEVQPPPIPGMRPPLGSPGGPVPAPKSSMGFVMPIYTICIIVFFVYTLSKILFKRSGSPYDPVTPDPQFRRRVFRDDSRSSPDKLGHKETDTRDEELAALKARLAETERAMQRIVGQLAQRDAEALDNARAYANGTILLNSGPVHIVTSEYRESKENTSEPVKEKSPEPVKKTAPEPVEPKETVAEVIEASPKLEEIVDDVKESAKITEESTQPKDDAQTVESESNYSNAELEQPLQETEPEKVSVSMEQSESHKDETIEPTKLSEGVELDSADTLAKLAEDFLNEERYEEEKQQKESTPELLEEALKEDSPVDEEMEVEKESSTVKVVGMEVTAHPVDGGAWRPEPPKAPQPPPQRPHEAEEVTSIYLETEIPQQTRVLIADFAQDRTDGTDRTDRPKPAKNAPLVVSGKITLSLIQDEPRETPERDPESTVDDYTTASAFTQPAAEKEGEELSDEEIEEEIEIEEIEEEIEEIEEEEEEEEEPQKTAAKK